MRSHGDFTCASLLSSVRHVSTRTQKTYWLAYAHVMTTDTVKTPTVKIGGEGVDQNLQFRCPCFMAQKIKVCLSLFSSRARLPPNHPGSSRFLWFTIAGLLHNPLTQAHLETSNAPPCADQNETTGGTMM